MAELSQVFGFLIIFKDSFKLIPKNVKFMAPITILSLLLPSLLYLIFYQTLAATQILDSDSSSSSSHFPILTTLSFSLFTVISILAFFKITNTLAIATILVSATSSTDTMMSPQDLYSRIKTANKRKVFGYRFGSSKRLGITIMSILGNIVFTSITITEIYNPNPTTITATVVVGVCVFVFELYASVATVLSRIVSVVEEKYEWPAAVERAEELVEGQRHHGFMISLFINSVLLIVFLGFLLAFGGNVWTFGFWLIMVNIFSLSKMYGCVAYTVLYYRCKKYHGEEEMGGVGNFEYSKLPASTLGGDVP